MESTEGYEINHEDDMARALEDYEGQFNAQSNLNKVTGRDMACELPVKRRRIVSIN